MVVAQHQLATSAPDHNNHRRISFFEEGGDLAPGQLYSTESGRLFHAGKIAIVTVGLPARGKTHLSVSLSRYLKWLGVKVRVFHLGDYRREVLGSRNLPQDYFWAKANDETLILRQQILEKCRVDLLDFFDVEKGQVAIYDAVNPTSKMRRDWKDTFAEHDIQTIFIESICDNQEIIEQNVRSVKISSPDYVGWNPDDAVKDYIARINAKIPDYEPVSETDFTFIKMINVNQRMEVRNATGYLASRIVFYLMNLHTQRRTLYFARAGRSLNTTFKSDDALSPEGKEYAQHLTDCLLSFRKGEHAKDIEQGEKTRSLTIWTSTRLRTKQTAECFPSDMKHYARPELVQLNPGDCDGLKPAEILARWPEETGRRKRDPYHHRYPRAESYHDLANRLWPVMLEMEREVSDLLIIAHESVLRVLCAYFMENSADQIPFMSFPRNEIVEVIPGAYKSQIKRIHIDGVAP